MRNEVKLVDLADAINAKHREAAMNCEQVSTAMRSALVCAAETGALLDRAKRLAGHGRFGAWLAEYCPDIPASTAGRYLALHRHRAELSRFSGKSEAYRALGLIGSRPEQMQHVDLGEALFRRLTNGTTSILGALECADLDDMPTAQRDALRGKLRPLVEVYEKLGS